jgi:hypothetical protein
MSLLDAFLRDAWQQPVVRSDVFIAIRTDGATGSGTEYDPYNGKGYVGDLSANATRFDSILSDTSKVPDGTTVRLGPTTSGSEFLTRGFNVTDATAGLGWSPASRNGLRLVGSGVNETTLKVVGHTAFKFAVAIGNHDASHFVSGFEASDFTVDCAITSTSTSKVAIGAVALTGRHVWLRRLRVINFGLKGSEAPASYILSTGRAHYSNGNIPYDCVIESCVLESPYFETEAAAPVTCLHLGAKQTATWANNKWHQACVIRDCYVDCGSANLGQDFRGITVFGGIGSIVECNRILNCRRGGPYRTTADSVQELPVKDLIVRENYYYNVVRGIELIMPGSGSDTQNVNNRLIVDGNELELALLPASEGPQAMKFTGSSSTSPRRFGTLIVQNNAIRPKDNDTTTQATRYGSQFDSCGEAVVEDNVINLGASSGGENPPDNAVRRDNSVAKLKVFNNEKSSGDFLPVFNSQSGLHGWELTNEAEDAFLVR